MNKTIEYEILAFEDAIEEIIHETLPQYSRVVLSLPIVKDKIISFGDMMIPFMSEETGLVDGLRLHEALKMAKPTLSNWVMIPKNEFRLVDVVHELKQTIIGG